MARGQSLVQDGRAQYCGKEGRSGHESDGAKQGIGHDGEEEITDVDGALHREERQGTDSPPRPGRAINDVPRIEVCGSQGQGDRTDIDQDERQSLSPLLLSAARARP